MSRLPLTLGVAGTVVLIDQVTKALAVARLEGQPSVELIGQWLQLTFVRNPGAAFSLAGNYTILISAIALIVAVAIVRTARTLTSTWWAVVLGGILGGALGNLIDRLIRSPAPFRGHVVDFLELPNWPVFNVADMALVGSAILAVLLSIRGVEMGESDAADTSSDPARSDADPAPGADPGASPDPAPDAEAVPDVAADPEPDPAPVAREPGERGTDG